MLATTRTAGAAPSSELPEGLALASHYKTVVEQVGACALPGVSVKYDTFMPCMWRAVATGFVRHEHAVFVAEGLRYGFKAGIDVAQLTGHRWFKNYQSALEGREAVTRATMKRVGAGKTLHLGTWTTKLADGIKSLFRASSIFPLGATPKPLEPTELRPIDDHSRTGLNAASSLEGLRHSLNAYTEISWFLQLDHFMRVSDVEGAFTILPLHPDVWPFFMFRFFSDSSAALQLFMHVCGDFGAAGMPGTFKLFFVDVVVQMARSVQVLSLPMTVYVDDCSLMGPCADEVDAEMLAFHAWALEVCGIAFKAIKDRVAAQRQLCLGFWWDSTTLTRELEEGKLLSYLQMLAECAASTTLTLREMRSVAGRMQRCIMSFPPGAAWLLVPLFALMSRLKLPHQRRRTTKEVRDNFKYCSTMLQAALGRGYYSFANFLRAPSVWTDASKSRGYTGGGFVSACGRYDFWKYGSRASRKLIDELEGDTVVVACTRLAYLWTGCIVTIYCDNKAFEQSGAKGRSRAPRLNLLIKELYLLMIKFRFVIEWVWIATDDNVNADHLSRDREQDFLSTVYESGCWASDTAPIRMEGAGRQRVLPEKRGEVADSADEDEGATYFKRAQAAHGSNTFKARRGGSLMLVLALFGAFCVPTYEAARYSAQAASVSYAPASIFDGLPRDLLPIVETVLDNRLASSSWRKVKAGVRIWREVADDRGWAHIISTDDPHRGAKLVAFVMHMLADTDLVWGSIQTYVWGVRTWMKAQHQADPAMGLREWGDFMAGVKVLSWAPTEPRRRCPVEVVSRILDAINLSSFVEVQLAFIILVLLYTFSRTECPCPKTFEGRDAYDPDTHFRTSDFDVRHAGGRRALFVRFRVIKQDQRVERPEARGDGDWSVVGDVDEPKFSPVHWFLRLQKFHGPRADKRGPMFLDPDRSRPLLYRKLSQQFRALQERVGVPEEELTGPHGLRVEGFYRTKNGLGLDLAAAHGLWSSTACKRYDRFPMTRVVRIPSVIVGLDDGDSAPTNEAEERSAGPPSRRMRRGDVRRRAEPEGDVSEDEGSGDPFESDELQERDVESGEESPSEESSAAGALLSLTPGGSTARPAGYWGQTSRAAPRRRAQSPPTRRSPSTTRD